MFSFLFFSLTINRFSLATSSLLCKNRICNFFTAVISAFSEISFCSSVVAGIARMRGWANRHILWCPTSEVKSKLVVEIKAIFPRFATTPSSAIHLRESTVDVSKFLHCNQTPSRSPYHRKRIKWIFHSFNE